MKFNTDKIEIVCNENGDIKSGEIKFQDRFYMYSVLDRAIAIVNAWPEEDPAVPQIMACTVTLWVEEGVVHVESANPSRIAVLRALNVLRETMVNAAAVPAVVQAVANMQQAAQEMQFARDIASGRNRVTNRYNPNNPNYNSVHKAIQTG